MVEEIIERHFRFPGVFPFEPRVERIEPPGLCVLFHLAIPSLGIPLRHSPEQFGKLFGRQFCHGFFDFGERAHGGKVASIRP